MRKNFVSCLWGATLAFGLVAAPGSAELALEISEDSQSDLHARWDDVETALHALSQSRSDRNTELSFTLKKDGATKDYNLSAKETYRMVSIVGAALENHWEPFHLDRDNQLLSFLMPRSSRHFRIVRAKQTVTLPLLADGILESLQTQTAYRVLAELAPSWAASGNIPTTLVNDEAVKALLAETEDVLFDKWISRSDVQVSLASFEMQTLLAELFRDGPVHADSVFDQLLLIWASERQDTLWKNFYEKEISVLSKESSCAKEELAAVLSRALQREWRVGGRARNVLVHIAEDESAIRQENPLDVAISYRILPGVKHAVSLEVYDEQGTLVHQMTEDVEELGEGFHDARQTLPGFEKSGYYELMLKVESEYGHIATTYHSFFVAPLGEFVDEEERLQTLNLLFFTAMERGEALEKERRKVHTEHKSLHEEMTQLHEELSITQQEIQKDKEALSKTELHSKWVLSGRYDSYNKRVTHYKTLNREFHSLKDSFHALGQDIEEIESLTQPLGKALNQEKLNEAVSLALKSSVTEKLSMLGSLMAVAKTSELASRAPQEVAQQEEEAPNTVSPEDEFAAFDRFSQAVLNNDLAGIQKAVDDGINVNQRDPWDEEHILHRFVMSETPQLETLELLLKLGISSDAEDPEGNGLTAFTRLALSSHDFPDRKAIMERLITQGCTLDQNAMERIRHKQKWLTALQKNLEEEAPAPFLASEALELLKKTTQVTSENTR